MHLYDPKTKGACMKSVTKKALVKTSFSIEDIQGLLKEYKYKWSNQQCKDFLLEHECFISDQMCEVGWNAIENEMKQCNELELGFIKPEPTQVIGYKNTFEARWYKNNPFKEDDHIVIKDSEGIPLTNITGELLHKFLVDIKSELIPPSTEHKLGIYEKKEIFYLV